MSRTRRYKVAHMSMTMWSRSAREGYTGAGTRRKKRHLGYIWAGGAASASVIPALATLSSLDT